MKNYILTGMILSPLHIGAGVTWEPFDYYINKKVNKLFRFRIEQLLQTLTLEEIDHFNQLNDRADLEAVRNFVTTKAKEKLNGRFNAIMVTNAVVELYDDKITDISNQLLIEPMVRSRSNDVAIIPGSSLKGAIRTAVVSELAGQSNLPRPKPFGKEAGEFESKVLNYFDVKKDPFRAVKIADVQLGKTDSLICQVYNVSKNKNGNLQQNSFQQLYEVCHSKISAKFYQTGVSFTGELRLDVPLMQKSGGVSRKITIEQIRDFCNHFYKDKMQMEHDKFYSGSALSEFSEILLDEKYSDHEFLLRVGRFSGVESVTLDNYRDPQVPDKNKGWGNTRNIADGKFPMGWIKLTFKELN